MVQISLICESYVFQMCFYYNCLHCVTDPMSVGQKVAEMTPEQVAKFIISINLGGYSKIFVENEIDGEMMMNASEDDIAEVVPSRLHRVKIVTLFKRKFLGVTFTR